MYWSFIQRLLIGGWISEEPFLSRKNERNFMNRCGYPKCIVLVLLRNVAVSLVSWEMLRYRKANEQLENVADLGSYVVSVRDINMFTIWRNDCYLTRW
jgi:hypothetical protein